MSRSASNIRLPPIARNLPLGDQIFGVAQTIPIEDVISGICIKDYQEGCGEGYGRLSAEATFGMRHGDFDPHIAIREQIVAGRRFAQNRTFFVKPEKEIPPQHQHLYVHKDWAVARMFEVMDRMYKDFFDGIIGAEFMFELKTKEVFYVDFYHFTSPLPRVSRAR